MASRVAAPETLALLRASLASSVDEVAAFLFEEDFEQIQRWVDLA